jgi:predicted transcriptional regulator
MTVMGRLADGGLLSRDRVGRAYRYAAVGTREQLTASTIREQLNTVSGDDRRAAILHFLDDASADEISELKAALALVEARQARENPERDAEGRNGVRP